MKAVREFFSRFSRSVALMVAHPLAFILAVVVVIIWACLGPWLDYSDQWQLVINTGTTILTFLMVFLLQNTQNRDSRAIQVKLDELLRAVDGARNELIDLEDISEEELARYSKEFHELHLQYARELEHRGRAKRPKSPGATGANPTVRPRPITPRQQQESGER
jgi:low affinity Fe/Cu permease